MVLFQKDYLQFLKYGHFLNWSCFASFQVLQNILETETEYSKDLQSLMTNYLRPLQSIDKYDSFTHTVQHDEARTSVFIVLREPG